MRRNSAAAIVASLAIAAFAIAAFAVAPAAYARPEYYHWLLGELPPENRVDARVRCSVCHDGPGLNRFGVDFARHVLRAPDRRAALRELFPVDSDGDGRSNFRELMEGTNPGRPDAPAAFAPRFR